VCIVCSLRCTSLRPFVWSRPLCACRGDLTCRVESTHKVECIQDVSACLSRLWSGVLLRGGGGSGRVDVTMRAKSDHFVFSLCRFVGYCMQSICPPPPAAPFSRNLCPFIRSSSHAHMNATASIRPIPYSRMPHANTNDLRSQHRTHLTRLSPLANHASARPSDYHDENSQRHVPIAPS
jgi:hypothetical protein